MERKTKEKKGKGRMIKRIRPYRGTNGEHIRCSVYPYYCLVTEKHSVPFPLLS